MENYVVISHVWDMFFEVQFLFYLSLDHLHEFNAKHIVLKSSLMHEASRVGRI